MQRVTLTVTTDGSGNAEAYTPRLSGELHSIRYVKAGANNYTDGVDVSMTVEGSGEDVWVEANVNASATRAPRQPTHSTAGAAALYAAGGTAVLARIALGNQRVKIALAQGGANKTGTFHILLAR